MNEFMKALISNSPKKENASKLNLFGQFIGEWDFEWMWIGDGNRDEAKRIKGEWIFSWVLNGTAIQDVWICPSRKEISSHSYSQTEFGTTIRFYNPNNDEWNIVYGCSDYMTILNARQDGDDIILEAKHIPDYKMRWVFSDITGASFTWRNLRSDDNGVTWRTQGEMHVTRKN